MERPQTFLTSNVSTTLHLTLFLSGLLFSSLLIAIPTSAVEDELSLVELSVDDHSKSVLLGEFVTFTFTLTNLDEEFDQNVEIEVLFVGGEGPEYELSEEYVDVPADFTATTDLTIDCSDCTEDETISIVVQGHDKGGANSGNDTNTVSLLVTPVLEYDLEVSASSTGQSGDSTVAQGDTLLWDFTIINAGWEDDEFEISLLDLGSFGGLFGILDDDDTTDLVMLQIPGTGSNGQNYAILSVVFIPADDEIPGSHDFSLDVFGLDGGSESLENIITITIPSPDLTVRDVTFSHTSSVSGQLVTTSARVANDGGRLDIFNNVTSNVDIWFLMDGVTITVICIDLAPGEETTVSFNFTSTIGVREVTARINDYDLGGYGNCGGQNIVESNEGNNVATNSLNVVSSIVTTPSFTISFYNLLFSITLVSFISTHFQFRKGESH